MNKLMDRSKRFMKRHGSTMLTCAGAIGTVTSVVMAVRATPKAMILLEEAKQEKGDDLTKLETVKVAGPAYIPSVVTCAATVVCIFGANVLNKRQQAALASAYALLDRSYKEYKAKLIELHGEEAHQEIIHANMIEKTKDVYLRGAYMVGACDLSLEENDGEPRLFYDEYGNRYFEATIEQVMSAEYHLNRNYVLRGCADLNEFYEFLGLEPTDYGTVLGWAPQDEGMYWIEFNHSKVVLDDGLEVYVIEMPFEPFFDYNDY